MQELLAQAPPLGCCIIRQAMLDIRSSRRLHRCYAVLIFLVASAMLTTVLGLAACRKAPREVATPEERLSGTLRLPLNSDLPTLDPIHIIDVRSAAVARQIFSTLIRFDPDLRIVPDLAERWEVSEDRLHLTFHLKHGAYFSNGEEVTAQDFVYSFTRLADPANASERATLLRDVKGYQELRAGKAKVLAGVTAPERYQFKVELSKPYAPFLSSLAMTNFAVVPKEEVEKDAQLGAGYWSRHPVGSGPFMLADWQPDSYIRVEPNPDYFGPKALLDSVLYKVIPDATTQFEAYRNDELDATIIPVGSLRRVQNDPALESELLRQPLLVVQFYVFNMEKKPWKDFPFESKRALRQAVNYAIDREYISNEILEGRYEPFVGIIPPGLRAWYNPDNTLRPRYTYDVDKARQLIDVAGHPEGLFLPRIPMYYNNFAEYPQIALQVADFLRDVSIRVVPRVLEWATFLDTMQRGEFLLGRSGWVADFPDPDNFLWQLLASENRGSLGNWARYSNPEFDQLVEKARVEFDQQKRKLLYWKAEQIALEDAPWLFLFTQVNNMLLKSRVHGVRLSGMDVDASLPNVDLSKVYLRAEARASEGASGAPDARHL